MSERAKAKEEKIQSNIERINNRQVKENENKN